MPIEQGEDDAIANRFLRALPPATLKRITPHIEPVALVAGSSIYRVGASVRRLYFINRGFVSIVKTMQDGRTVEIGTKGHGDIVGLFSLHGIDPALWDSIVQVPGSALRLNTEILRAEMDADADVRRHLERYTLQALSSLAQNAACHSLHGLKQRLCRWLLAAMDAAGTATLPLTHETLALMLGVQRSGVSLVASALHKAGAIRSNRGSLTILDRTTLEAGACECRHIAQHEPHRQF